MAQMVQVRRGSGQRYGGPDIKIGRSQFNRSHTLKTTFDASYLVPILLDEVLPGDTVTCKMNGFARIFSPLLSPVMDNIQLETFFFFTPTRLLWDNWEAMNGAHDAAGAQDTDYTVPVWSSGTAVASHSLANYLGLPVDLESDQIVVSALPFRNYELVYNEWFRDQNLIDELTIDTSDATDTTAYGLANTYVRKSAKKHDYFTSALPYLQKGDAVTAAVTGLLYVQHGAADGSDINVYADDNAAFHKLDSNLGQVDASATAGIGAADALYVDLSKVLGAQTSGATVDVNALRYAVAVQRLLERDARGGTRYVEQVKTQFGVTVPDFRAQRPEFLGGGKSYINISPVANASGVDATVSVSGSDEPQGMLAGVGAGSLRGHGFAKSFVEHGYILGLVRARGDLTYFQGLDKLWSRQSRYDFYIPALAMLGEQSILNKEIFVSNVTATDDAVFGYQERWAEYRMKHSLILGKFSPNVAGALSEWHVAEDFSALPSLNQTFIQDATPMDRVVAVTTEPDFIMDVHFDYKWARPIPVRSIPSLSGRF